MIGLFKNMTTFLANSTRCLLYMSRALTIKMRWHWSWNVNFMRQSSGITIKKQLH